MAVAVDRSQQILWSDGFDLGVAADEIHMKPGQMLPRGHSREQLRAAADADEVDGGRGAATDGEQKARAAADEWTATDLDS